MKGRRKEKEAGIKLLKFQKERGREAHGSIFFWSNSKSPP